MELEYIFKIFIMLIVVAVIIGLILTFRDQIVALTKSYIQSLYGGNKIPNFPQYYEGTFTSINLATYIQSCYSAITSLPIDQIPAGVTNCYILHGNFNADSVSILNGISDSDLRGKINITADFSKDVVVISYQDPQGIISVK